MAGLTLTGFEGKTAQEIFDELCADARISWGPGINLEPQSNFGQLFGVMADRLADVWQLAEAVYSATTPDGAVGQQLDDLCAITGVVRLPATKTKVKLTLTGTASTLIPAGRIVKTALGVRYQTLADATIGGGGTVSDVDAEAIETGPTPATASSITVIETAVSGWTAVNTPTDHYQLGSDIETDTALRARRVIELSSQGFGTVDGIRNALLDVTGVTSAFVEENESDSTVFSMAPHSIRAYVRGGASADIAKAIFENKPAGIAMNGANSYSYQDEQGVSHTIKWETLGLIQIYLDVDVTVDAAVFPADGAAQIKAALAAYGDANLKNGDSVIRSQLIGVCFDIPGVLDVTGMAIDAAASPTIEANYTISSPALIADLDTGRITVNVT
jgi:uncharacterized phage protein gp47/JayE